MRLGLYGFSGFFIRPYYSRQRGSLVVEAASSIGVFLFIIFLFCSLGAHLYHQVGLQFAVNETARWASIGGVEYTDSSKRKIKTITPYTFAEIQQQLISTARRYGVALTPAHIRLNRVCSSAETAAQCNPAPLLRVSDSPDTDHCATAEITARTCVDGGAGVFRLSVSKPVKLVFGFATLSLDAHAVGLTEG